MSLPLVEEVMVKFERLITFKQDQNIYDAMSLLIKHKISGAPVVDDKNHIIGIISEKDCLKVLTHDAYHQHPKDDNVVKYMSKEVESIKPNVDILAAAKYFLDSNFRRLPVVDGERLLGQISRRDVIRAIENMRH